jgi:adenylate cyclase
VLDDIFDLQDRVTMSVIGAILPHVERAEIERARRKPTESLHAYDYYLRALAASYRYSREANLELLELTQRANAVDPDFALAYALAAASYAARKAFGWTTDFAADIGEIRRLSAKAIELGKDDARVLMLSGFPLAYVAGEVERAASLVSQAIQLDPNLGAARLWMGWIHVYQGDHDAAIGQLETALRLNPLDPRRYSAMAAMAYAHFFAGRHEEAWKLADAAVRQQPNYVAGQVIMMMSNVATGRLEAARQCSTVVTKLDPSRRVSGEIARAPFRRPQDIKKHEEACRAAGLPE